MKAHCVLDWKQLMKKTRGSGHGLPSHKTSHGNVVVKEWHHSSDRKRLGYVLHGQQGQTEEERRQRSEIHKVDPLNKPPTSVKHHIHF